MNKEAAIVFFNVKGYQAVA